MSVRRLALLTPALALGLLAPFAHADFTPVVEKKDLFLTCDAGTREYASSELTGGAQPTWADKAPASVTTGAGCGKADDGVFSGAIFRTPFQLGFGGTYTGNLDAITVTLHSLNASPGRATNAPARLDVRMTVDGISMFGAGTATSAAGQVNSIPAPKTVMVTPTGAGSTGQVTQYQFTVTGLDLLLEKDTGAHDIAFDIAAPGPVAQGWLWGAAEAPSGVTISPATPAKAVVKADARTKREADLEQE